MPKNYKGCIWPLKLLRCVKKGNFENIRHHFDGSPCQLASTLGWGHRHALLYDIMQWLLWLETVVKSVSIATMCQEPSSKSAKCICICQDPEVHWTISGKLPVRPQSCRRCDEKCSTPFGLTDVVFQGKYLPRNLHTLYAPISYVFNSTNSP